MRVKNNGDQADFFSISHPKKLKAATVTNADFDVWLRDEGLEESDSFPVL